MYHQFMAEGNYFRRRGDYLQAIEMYDKFLDLDPDSAQGYLYRGICKHNREQFRQAIKDYCDGGYNNRSASMREEFLAQLDAEMSCVGAQIAYG